MKDESKISLSDQKLKLEIAELEKPWYKKPSFLQSMSSTLIIGILLACVTVLFNYLSEKSLVKNSFTTEFNKIKVQKIGETWEVLNVWEAETDELLQLAKKVLESKKDSVYILDEWEAQRLMILKKSMFFDTEYYKVQQNRFWIGNEQYKLMGDFALLIAEKQDIYLNFRKNLNFDSSIIAIDNKINQKRSIIDSVVIQMLE